MSTAPAASGARVDPTSSRRWWRWWRPRRCRPRWRTCAGAGRSCCAGSSKWIAVLSPVRRRDARRQGHYPTARDRPDPCPPAPPCAPRPPRECPRHPIGVSRVRPRLWILGSGSCRLHAGWLGAPLGPDPDPARAGGRPVGPGIRAPAPARPPASASPQPPWTVHSPSRTLGGPIEIPIPKRATKARRTAPPTSGKAS